MRVALVHELIHHWEHLERAEGGCPNGYPVDVEALARRLLPDALRQRRWRERHTPRYIAKARTVCARLEIPLETLLYPGLAEELKPEPGSPALDRRRRGHGAAPGARPPPA